MSRSRGWTTTVTGSNPAAAFATAAQVRRAVRLRVRAGAVGHHHEQTVRDAVADDHLLPQRLGVEVRVIWFGPDRRRVDEDVRAAECVRARDLGKPLVPAGRQTDARVVKA